MRKLFLLALIALFFIQCEKNESPEILRKNQDYIVAGDSINITQYLLGDYVEFILDGDTKPTWFTGSSSSYFDTPIDIDEDNEFDIRYSAYNFLTYNVLIYRALFLSNNYGNFQNYEFAIIEQDTVGMNNDTLKFAKLFDMGDTISLSERWYSSTDPSKKINQFFILYYYDYDFHNRTMHPNDTETIEGRELFINKSALNKYVGIRKKVKDVYIYGYLQIHFENYDNFKLIKSGFADK